MTLSRTPLSSSKIVQNVLCCVQKEEHASDCSPCSECRRSNEQWRGTFRTAARTALYVEAAVTSQRTSTRHLPRTGTVVTCITRVRPWPNNYPSLSALSEETAEYMCVDGPCGGNNGADPAHGRPGSRCWTSERRRARFRQPPLPYVWS